MFCLLCGFSRNLCCYHIGQYQHNHVNLQKPSASHPNVPFPQPLGLCGYWVSHISHAQYDREFPVAGCIAQLGSDVIFGMVECFLLAAMARDRYLWASVLHFSTLPSAFQSHPIGCSAFQYHPIGCSLSGVTCECVIIYWLFIELDFLWAK